MQSAKQLTEADCLGSVLWTTTPSVTQLSFCRSPRPTFWCIWDTLINVLPDILDLNSDIDILGLLKNERIHHEINHIEQTKGITHFRLIKLPPHYILEELISILGISGYVI